MTPEMLFTIAHKRGLSMDFGRPPRQKKPKSASSPVVSCRDCLHMRERKIEDIRYPCCASPLSKEPHRVIDTYPKRPDWCPGPRPVHGHGNVTGTQTRVARLPQYSSRELALAAMDMDRKQWAALCWCWGLDQQSRPTVHAHLLSRAAHFKETEHWPATIKRGHCPIDKCGAARCSHRYLEDFVVLALLEGAHPNEFGTESMRARFFGITEQGWRRQISKLYRAVSAELENLVLGGVSHMRRRLRGDDGELEGVSS